MKDPKQPVITKADMHPSHYNDFEWRVAKSSPYIGILMNETYEHDEHRQKGDVRIEGNALPLNSFSVDPNTIAKNEEETHAALDTLAVKAKENQASYNYHEFCKFVNGFKAQGMNPGEAPTVFHIDLRARGHRVTLTGAPGELLVNVRATGPKKTLKQRFLNLFRK